MKVEATAQAIKDYLIKLAIDDELPEDLNELDLSALRIVIRNANDITMDDIYCRHPPHKQKAYKEAEHYLSGDENEIPRMVELIAKQEEIDGSLDIDYVNGVVVWEKVTNSFTCSAFLEQIGYTD